MNRDIVEIANKLVAPGKGILAADESNSTIGKRFSAISIPESEENRRAYREVLFTTDGIEDFISGVILYDETIRHKTKEGMPFPLFLTNKGIIPGIKVDKGLVPLTPASLEKVTEGLEGLSERLTEYYELGARFAKWRAVISISDSLPTQECIKENAQRLAEYAFLVQKAGMVPIVEPEVLMDGRHSLEKCFDVTLQTLQAVFDALQKKQVSLDAILLKPNMIVSGKDSQVQGTIMDVTQKTIVCLRKSVPREVAGIVFLSGGQNEILATEHLNEMNKVDNVPWQLSFSYGRALQQSVLQTWAGKAENIGAAQKVLYHRAKMNSLARFGKYSKDLEK